ncbi:hypothetical protein B0H15DRAFT_1022983 [Mycena belliarum]|uniref:Uncharacterized protein n=1 Tax=Mycena belliarum TaxID=1033014 RepID=A0AAD6U3Z1_9AGAR|nr:hypothetical protein B0H15DRAFT_1022983 [Mycena belliae]
MASCSSAATWRSKYRRVVILPAALALATTELELRACVLPRPDPSAAILLFYCMFLHMRRGHRARGTGAQRCNTALKLLLESTVITSLTAAL